MNPIQEHFALQTRRSFLHNAGLSLGGIALASLLSDDAPAESAAAKQPAANPLAAKSPPQPATAKRVIYLHMAGSPPQHELFDFKPELAKLDGKPCPESLYKKERFAFIKGVPNMLGPQYKFAKHGESGAELSELLPNLATVADDLTIVRSMYTDQFNHAPAQMLLYTGFPRFGRASLGSWVTYGLGTENQDLPGFVVLVSGGKAPSAGKSAWGSGFLPSVFQGVQCRSQGDPVLFASDPNGMSREVRRRSLDALNELNQQQLAQTGDPEIATRIAQYELAYRMQASVPEVMDISRETKQTQEMYGAEPGKTSFANNCLLARRLVEDGVRFVQLFDWGWDNHGTGKNDDLMHQLPKKCGETDRPIAALIRDLKQRGLLEDTLVVWSGEFGRTPMNEERNGSKFLGRDHHPHCFTILMAGGGMKPGLQYGKTDDIGYHVVEGKSHVHDLQATILHTLGFDHTRLTYRFQGLDIRLTNFHGNVMRDWLA
jgi:hypothetical protein